MVFEVREIYEIIDPFVFPRTRENSTSCLHKIRKRAIKGIANYMTSSERDIPADFLIVQKFPQSQSKILNG